MPESESPESREQRRMWFLFKFVEKSAGTERGMQEALYGDEGRKRVIAAGNAYFDLLEKEKRSR